MEFWNSVDSEGLPVAGKTKKASYALADPYGSHVYTISRDSHDVTGGKTYGDSDLRRIRAASRRAAMSGTIGPMICNARILDAIGNGINPIPTPPMSIFKNQDEYAKWKNAANYEFQHFLSSPVNVNGLNLFVDDLWDIVSTCIFDGDCFVKLMYDEEKKKTTGSGLCWRIIPGSSVCNKDYAQNGGYTINGITYNKYGRAISISYAIRKDNMPLWRDAKVYDSRGSRLLYYVKLPSPNFYGSGFKRGLPLIANVIDEINIVDEYRRAALSKVASENNIVGAIGGADEDTDSFLLGQESEASGPIKYQRIGNGTFLTLRGNEKITPFNLSNAAVQYPDFAIAMINEICAATGTTPEVARMIFGGSYSGSMAAENKNVKRYETDRSSINYLISELYTMFISEKVASGEMKADGFFSSDAIKRQFCRLQIAWPAKGAINPLMQSRADALDVQTGALTQEQLCASRGLDYQEVFAQRLIEAANEKRINDARGEQK